jgi:hypothetical protein
MTAWSPLPPSYAGTRAALHAVAEHVLAVARHSATGRIGLQPAPGGFATPEFDGTVLRVDGDELVVVDGGSERRVPLTTLGAAADAVGIAPGADTGVFARVTPADPATVLGVDRAGALALAAWFAAVDDALAQLAAAHVDQSPSAAQLWPEHFDLALTMAEVNYGGSPGDDFSPDPYAYVGPWQARTGPFWNAPFGAVRPAAELASADEILAFFEEGRRRAVAG